MINIKRLLVFQFISVAPFIFLYLKFLAKSEAQFSFIATSTTILENSKLELSCIIDSTKYKVPTMRKSGSNANLPIVGTTGENNIVTYIYSKPITELSDAGTYVCQVENQRGTNTLNETVDIVIDSEFMLILYLSADDIDTSCFLFFFIKYTPSKHTTSFRSLYNVHNVKTTSHGCQNNAVCVLGYCV